MRFDINLATRTYVNQKRLNIAIVLAIALLCAILLLNIKTIASNAGESARLEKEIGALEGKFKANSGGVSEKDYQGLLTRIKFANGVIDRKTLNWPALLDRLERVIPDGVAVSSIEPDMKGGGLKLAGDALRFNNLRKLLENLEDSKFFTDIYLTAQGDKKVGETQKGIAFTITCAVDYKKL